MVRGSAATSYTYAATPHFEDAAQPHAEWEQLRVNVSTSEVCLGASDLRAGPPNPVISFGYWAAPYEYCRPSLPQVLRTRYGMNQISGLVIGTTRKGDEMILSYRLDSQICLALRLPWFWRALHGVFSANAPMGRICAF